MIRGKSLSLRFVCSTPKGYSVVIPKSVAARATARNKARRVAYSILQATETCEMQGIFYVRALPNNYASMFQQEMLELLEKARKQCDIQAS